MKYLSVVFLQFPINKHFGCVGGEVVLSVPLEMVGGVWSVVTKDTL